MKHNPPLKTLPLCGKILGGHGFPGDQQAEAWIEMGMWSEGFVGRWA
jgi:hypothetical protein